MEWQWQWQSARGPELRVDSTYTTLAMTQLGSAGCVLHAHERSAPALQLALFFFLGLQHATCASNVHFVATVNDKIPIALRTTAHAAGAGTSVL